MDDDAFVDLVGSTPRYTKWRLLDGASCIC
jgi:hypothetical protein